MTNEHKKTIKVSLLHAHLSLLLFLRTEVEKYFHTRRYAHILLTAEIRNCIHIYLSLNSNNNSYSNSKTKQLIFFSTFSFSIELLIPTYAFSFSLLKLLIIIIIGTNFIIIMNSESER